MAEGGHLLEERLDRAAIVDRHRDPTPARLIVEQNGGYPGRLGEGKARAHGGIAHGARGQREPDLRWRCRSEAMANTFVVLLILPPHPDKIADGLVQEERRVAWTQTVPDPLQVEEDLTVVGPAKQALHPADAG